MYIELIDAAFMCMTMAAGNPARKYDIVDHSPSNCRARRPPPSPEAVDVVKRIVKKQGGDKFWLAKNDEAEVMWTVRKNGHYAGLAYAGEGVKAWSTGVWCVSTCGYCPH